MNRLEVFFRQFKPMNFKKGETILRASEAPPGVYFLEKGYARLYAVSKKGEELTLIIFKSGDPFPIIWAINDTPNNYFLEAMTECTLLRIPKDKFVEFVKSNPEILFDVTRRMLARFGGLLTRMEYLVFGNAYAKVASIIIICAERFGRKRGKKIVIQVPLTHNDIANLVGITRETASLELKKLENKGLIDYERHLLPVKNLKGLREESLLETLES